MFNFIGFCVGRMVSSLKSGYQDGLNHAAILEAKNKLANLDSDIINLLRDGKKFQAVKLHREMTGSSIKVALDHVTQLQASL